MHNKNYANYKKKMGNANYKKNFGIVYMITTCLYDPTRKNALHTKLNTVQCNKLVNLNLQFENVSYISFYRIVLYIFVYSQFLDGPLWGFGKYSSWTLYDLYCSFYKPGSSR